MHLRATLYVELDRPAEALEAYREALLYAPRESGWRLEWARLLMQQKQWDKARGQLDQVEDSEEKEKLRKELEQASTADNKAP
jgi:hypothetical protein